MNTEYQQDNELSYVAFDNVVNPPAPHGWHQAGIRNTWDDEYIARKTVFADGQMEISVCREKKFNGSALIRKPKAKRGESENREANDIDAGKAAKKKVREKCKTIGADRLVTLTYRENMTEREQALKDWKEFTRRLRKCIAFHYVAVMELQEGFKKGNLQAQEGRASIHFHVAVAGRQNYHLLRSIWQSVLGTGANGQKMGQINVRNPANFGFGKDGVHKLAAYLAKYCTKSMECREIDQKRFFSSRGIVKPEVIAWRLHSNDMLSACEVAFAIAAEGNLDGMVVYHNKGLQTIWIATAPGRSRDNPFSAPF